MMKLQEWPLWRQVTTWVSLITLAALVVLTVLVGRVYISSAHSRARTVANMVEDFGAWAGKYGGVWARSPAGSGGVQSVGDFLESMPIVGKAAQPMQDSGAAASTEGGFHRKNPALMQRELSEVTNAASGHGVKFRMTSDKFMNVRNAPTRFELEAIERIRESGATESSEIKGNRLLYARRLDVVASCMGCHDTPDKAPLSVRARYPDPARGYGYKLGDVAGIISVDVPIVDHNDSVASMLGAAGWTALGLLALLITGFLWFVKRRVLGPIGAMSQAAAQASMTDVSDLRAADWDIHGGPRDSRNEIHALAAAVKRLLRSVQMQRRTRT